jgi:hypothetical protein
MSEVIDITGRLKDRKIAEVLARDGGKHFCHPSDTQLFDWVPPCKVQTSNTMQQGKPYAIDIKVLMDLLQPKHSSWIISHDCDHGRMAEAGWFKWHWLDR